MAIVCFLYLEPTLNKTKSPLIFEESELVSSGSHYCLFHIVTAAKPRFVCNIIHCFATEANFLCVETPPVSFRYPPCQTFLTFFALKNPGRNRIWAATIPIKLIQFARSLWLTDLTFRLKGKDWDTEKKKWAATKFCNANTHWWLQNYSVHFIS